MLLKTSWQAAFNSCQTTCQ